MQLAKNILAKRIPALLWTIIIFILLALPGSMIPSEANFRIAHFDKYVHISLFCIFVILWSFHYAAKPGKNRSLFFVIFLIACSYGIAMEYVQKYFIPFRDFDLYDILADVAGAAAGYLLVRLLFLRQKNT